MKNVIVNPWWLLSFYIVFIIGFAIAYNKWFPDKFYHSTLKYEQGYSVLKDSVISDIDSAIVRNFESFYGKRDTLIPTKFLPAHINIERFRLNDLKVQESQLIFIGQFSPGDLWGLPSRAPRYFNYLFQLDHNSKTVSTAMNKGESRELTIYSGLDNPLSAKYIVPVRDTTSSPSIVLTYTQLERISRLIGYNNGIIKQNSFKRMLYFSAITIATIGYGDIVPTDDTLRLIVGFEAILGIIFIGLFINAVGDKLK